MARPIVLICDDNPTIAASIRAYLEMENMDVIAVESGEEAIQIINSQKISLLILDIMLPGISGLAVCKELRKSHRIPIIMLSAKGEESDRIYGLELGADDYVTKPFSPHEVAVRARVILKRSGENFDLDESEVKIGDVTLLPETLQVRMKSELIQLTPREFKLLRYLADHEGRVKSRDQLINALWGADFEGESRIVDTIVKNLRQKLGLIEGSEAGIRIVTVFGVGYRLEIS